MKSTAGSCFVAMPLHGNFLEYYDSIYAPAITSAGMKPTRGDSIFSAGDIVRQIVDAILESQIVLAEISEVNANVYYEIGIAHTYGRPVVLVAQSADVIPFDLRTGRCIIYDTVKPFWAESLQTALRQALTESVESPDRSRPAAFLGRASIEPEATDSDPVLEAIGNLSSAVARLTPLAFAASGYGLAEVADESAVHETAAALLQAGMTPQEVIQRLVTQGVSVTYAEFVVNEVRREKRRRS